MSFFAHYTNLPAIHTRKALLLLDFQNDFVRPNGALHVSNTAEFLDLLPQLATAFRRNGEVVWVRSHYRDRQPLVCPSDAQDLVVLGRMNQDTRRDQTEDDEGLDAGDEDPSPPVDQEAFLSVDPPRCCIPQTAGAQFPAPILAAIDMESDTVIDKTEYSALRDQGLILFFRTSFVTEIYLCGSLSNVSVYATALDAVRHGFAVTLIEDCLGFRSFARHEESMRRMADIFGANGITTEELSEELDWEETEEIARKGGPRPLQSISPAGIESVMDELEVKPSASPIATEESPESASSRRRRRIDDILAEFTDNEDGDLQELAKLTRARARYGAESHGGASQGGKGEKKIRSKVRRPKRSDAKPESASRSDKRRSAKSKKPDVYRPGDVIGEGDSRIIYDLDLPSEAFEKIREEVAWQKMYHLSGQVPRLVAVQGLPLADGSIPIYRHPADESPPLQPFTATVNKVRAIVERILGHPLNHALIQLYRDGQDRISEHSDKTLDIVRGSSICNVSLGAQRVMVLRTKGSSEDSESGRQTQRIPMPHESLFVLGEKTNMRWLHGIRPDKRAEAEKSIEERAYEGQRISLTFRHIGTFLDPAGDTIWGQGAVSKSQDGAHPVIHGDAAETERIIRAFGEENHATEFNWEGVYGGGFDVVNFVTACTTKLILGSDAVANLRVRLCLSENGIRYETSSDASQGTRPLFIAADGAQLAGDVIILSHFAERAAESVRPGVDALPGGDHLTAIDDLLASWRDYQRQGTGELQLTSWEDALDGQPYLSGAVFGIDDCSLWPVLREIAQTELLSGKMYPNLTQYYQRVEKRGIVKATLEE
ncbi:isochorismatase family protein family [Aspergillus sclerotioniger CBS 115572]|uniref:Isochorismatase family protein family n=1 Tax=Aspergillus sclerotioniger CBS 115572 TaxID=1450535 RepID=A0A317WLL7_9EURO|nr:isochorismatase family protein family [Aspergillus sclerotioniger CBS 115572]PWY86591.1 isochorismatase family protein family [Aspergillus sclerotioniger CBS 115572]